MANFHPGNEALRVPVLNATADSGAPVPPVEVTVDDRRRVRARTVIAPYLACVSESEDVQSAILFLAQDSLPQFGGEGRDVVAAKAKVLEAAHETASAQVRLVIKRNLAAALRRLQQRIATHRKRRLVAAQRDVAARIEFPEDPAVIGKGIVVLQRCIPPTTALKCFVVKSISVWLSRNGAFRSRVWVRPAKPERKPCGAGVGVGVGAADTVASAVDCACAVVQKAAIKKMAARNSIAVRRRVILFCGSAICLSALVVISLPPHSLLIANCDVA
jgi:hypothetical protein